MPRHPVLHVARDLLTAEIVVRLVRTSRINHDLLVRAGHLREELSAALDIVHQIVLAVKNQYRQSNVRRTLAHTIDRAKSFSSPLSAGLVMDHRVGLIRACNCSIARELRAVDVERQSESRPDA